MASYKLDTGKKYIKDIFSSDSFYNIPDYQRPYVWGKEQVLTFLEDIHKALERDKNKEYFLGCMVWNTKRIKCNSTNIEYTSQDILDGQQRFITLYLLHAVIRDITDNENIIKNIYSRLKQEGNELEDIPERNRIEFEIRKDKDFIDKYVLLQYGTLKKEELSLLINDDDGEISIKNMSSAIINMHDWFNEIKHFEEDFNYYLQNFYKYLGTKVLLLYLSTPDNLDDAYNLFTVLNSRGLQLQSSDILRAQNLRHIKDDNTRKKMAQKWEEYESVVDSPYNSFDEFLWSIVFIKMKYRSDDNQSIIKAFDFMYGRNMFKRGVETFSLIGNYIGHLQGIMSDDFCKDYVGQFFVNLNLILAQTFGNTYLYPLMHYRECFGDYKIYDFMIRIDQLCSVYWLTGNRNLQSRLFIVMRKMEEIAKSGNDKKELAFSFLNSPVLDYEYQDEKASTSIDINDFINLLDTEDWGAYAGQRINKTRYLLLKIDLLSSDISSKIYFDKKIMSVEHLMPRKLEEDFEHNISSEDHNLWVHRLGNIILINKKKNSYLSNKDFQEKKKRYKESIEGRANTNHIFMTYNNWGIMEVKENHLRTLNLLKAYYTSKSFDSFLKKINQK